MQMQMPKDTDQYRAGPVSAVNSETVPKDSVTESNAEGTPARSGLYLSIVIITIRMIINPHLWLINPSQ